MKQENSILFWLSRLVLTAASGVFLALGISVLKAAYDLDNPFHFIMTFFASNLMILISATLGLGFVLSMYRRLKWQPPAGDQPGDEPAEKDDARGE